MTELDNLIKTHFDAAQVRHPNLHLEKRNITWIVCGELHFESIYDGHVIDDQYQVEIYIPTIYPTKPPTVKEIGERIPKNFHHYNNDTLCLGTILEVNRTFKNSPTLLSFIEDQVIPYLFAYSYYKKYGKIPFNEWKHGGEGVLDFYYELFQTKSIDSTMSLLRILAENDYRGHKPCPCNKEKRLRECHGPQLLELKNIQPVSDFLNEYNHCFKYLKSIKYELLSSALITTTKHSRSQKRKRRLMVQKR